MKKNDTVKKKLLIIDRFPSTLTYKLIFFLKDFFDITLIAISKDKILEDYSKLGINFLEINFKDSKLKAGIYFLKVLIKERLNGKDFVLAKTAPNWIGLILFSLFKKSKKIYFPYDIYLFVWDKKQRSKLDLFSERYNFSKADFILHKGPEEELNLIKKEEVKKIKGVPLQLLPFCFDKWIIPLKKKHNLGKTNLVFIGTSVDKNNLFDIQFSDIFKIMAKNKLKVHLYLTNKPEKIKDQNIIYHEPLSNLELNKEMNMLDYGINLGFFNKQKVGERFIKTTLGNKLFSYLEAGIPVIVDDETEFTKAFVKKYRCGIIISRDELKDLDKIISKQDYPKLMEGVKVAREDLLMSKNIKLIVQKLLK